MAYKRTGNPVGRPKTREYVTLLARVPADLAELVKKYADQHRLSVATVLREGAAWRIGDGDPRGMGLYLEESTDTREKPYYENTEKVSGDEALQEIRALLARQWEQIQALAQALERQNVSTSDGVYSSNTSKPATEVAILYQEAQHTQLAPLAEEQVAGSAIPATMPPYDPAKHHLGKLCPGKHEWGTAGQSLRNADNQCLECKAQAKREKRAAKRQAQPVAG